MLNSMFLLNAGAAAPTGGAIFGIALQIGFFFLILWFLIIRPQKKRQKEINDMQNALKIGDSVLTTGGLYGKIVDDFGDILMIEFGTNKTVRVPIQKNAIASVKEPDLTITKKTKEEE